MGMRAQIERLRKLVEGQSETIKILEARSIAELRTSAKDIPEVRPASEMDRESLISSLAHWRSEHGVSDPQRYLRNRSTDQLRKMYSQVLLSGSAARVVPHGPELEGGGEASFVRLSRIFSIRSISCSMLSAVM